MLPVFAQMTAIQYLLALAALTAQMTLGAEVVAPANENLPISPICAQLASSGDGSAAMEQKLLLCQLYESSTLLAQLGALVSDGLDRLLFSQVGENGEVRDKRKHEYLRFGKRKHEYLRFGKRKHEYLRFG